MGQSASTRGASPAPPVQEAPRRCRTAAELCACEPRAVAAFRADELPALVEILESWCSERCSNAQARSQFLRRVMRGQDHISLALASSAEAAAQAGFQGAFSGADRGRAAAATFASAAAGLARQASSGTSLASNSNAQRVGAIGATVATGTLGALGMLAGGVVGGVTTALTGGARAGLQPRAVFIFIDRIFLRLSRDQAWELAAQVLDVDGIRPPSHETEAYFRAQLRRVWDDTPGTTKEAIWLRLVQLCISLELIRLLPSPSSRVQLPQETFFQELRFDQDFLTRRVEEVVAQLAATTKGRSAMSASEIRASCPVETLRVAVDEECPICLEAFPISTVVRRLPCSHIMHKECCEAWLQRASNCPMCRLELRSGDPRSGVG